MNDERARPRLDWTSLAWGLLVAVTVGVALITAASSANATVLGIVAPVFGCSVGGYLAGMLAKRDGLYHGVFVGVGWIALETFGLLPTVVGSGLGGAAETVAIIAFDVVLLAASCAGGFIATRS